MPVPDLTPLAGISEDDILEYSESGKQSSREDRFAYDVADLTMTYQVPGDKLIGFLMWMLGVDYVDEENVLRRTCPAFHPVHCWAWCKSVVVKGQGIDGDDDDIVRFDFQNTPYKWKKYVATCTYEMMPYHILYDDEVDNEYERFVEKNLIPKVELVSIDHGAVRYDANAGDSWHNKPHYSLGVVARRQTAGVRLTWHRVPLEYVQADDESLPTKLMQVQGCVNSASFFSQDAGVLLSTDVRFKKYVSPLLTSTIGSMYFLYDIEIDLLWLQQDDDEIGKTGETRRGHNLLLGPNMKYWYARNATSGLPIFRERDFSKVFTHYSDGF